MVTHATPTVKQIPKTDPAASMRQTRARAFQLGHQPARFIPSHHRDGIAGFMESSCACARYAYVNQETGEVSGDMLDARCDRADRKAAWARLNAKLAAKTHGPTIIPNAQRPTPARLRIPPIYAHSRGAYSFAECEDEMNLACRVEPRIVDGCSCLALYKRYRQGQEMELDYKAHAVYHYRNGAWLFRLTQQTIDLLSTKRAWFDKDVRDLLEEIGDVQEPYFDPFPTLEEAA